MYFYSVLNEVCILYFTSVQPEFLSRSRYLFDPNPNSDPNPIRSHPLCSLFGWRLLPFRMSLLLVISQLLLLPLMLSMAAVIKGVGKDSGRRQDTLKQQIKPLDPYQWLAIGSWPVIMTCKYKMACQDCGCWCCCCGCCCCSCSCPLRMLQFFRQSSAFRCTFTILPAHHFN